MIAESWLQRVFQVSGSVGRAAFRTAFKQMVLPVDDGLRVNITYEHAFEIGFQNLLDVVALLLQRSLSHARHVVGEVEIAREGELHRCRSRHLLLEVALPGLGLALRAKTSFRFLLWFTPPVLVSEVSEPSSSFFVLVSCHGFSFRFLG